jgi:Sensors of blue-light using FAD
MQKNEKVKRALCLSLLSENSDFSAFKRIVHSARRRNGQLGLTGVLVFDGERFCHLIEGPEQAFADVMQRIASDARHTGLTMLQAPIDATSRLLFTWRSGYCSPDDLDQFNAPGALAGDAAVMAFLAVLTRCDLAG